jgi:outer membrane lipoprotein-sorting protein
MRLIRMAAWLCAAFAGAPAAMAQPAPPPWGLPQLMQGLAQVHAASARFMQRETLKMLTAPLMSAGTLTYVAPDYLRKITTSPAPENFVLDRDQVTISGAPGQKTQVFLLTQDPRIGGLVEGIRATLAGDLPQLQRFYTVQLTGTAASWQLLLRPKDAGLAQFVTWIIILGHRNHLQSIDTASGNGDHSEMGITEDAPDAK